MPRVSAIITTFNRPQFLQKAIRSVLTQDDPDFELLVLDNSSTDNTPEIVKSFQDPRIRYIRHEPVGISRARNLGVKESRGEFIAFLDDDDEWLPGKIRVELSLFQKGNDRVALTYGGFQWFNDHGSILYEH